MVQTFMKLRGGNGAASRLARHEHTYAILEPLADAVLADARRDPNAAFRESLRKYKSARKIPGGKRSVRWVITGPTRLVARVEAARGTLRRAAKKGA